MTARPELPDDVVILPATPLDLAWEVFHRFEALHHGMDIMNPLGSEELDLVVGLVPLSEGDQVIEVACGHGELLIRLASGARIDGVGVDLSPWQIMRALRRAEEAGLSDSLRWWVGRGEDVPADASWDVAVCVGASWIWDGFEGTVRGTAALATSGGIVVVGDLRVRDEADPDAIHEVYDGALRRDEQHAVLADAGLDLLGEVVGSPDSWTAYDERTAKSARDYAARHPTEEVEGYLADQEAWAAEHVDDHHVMSFAVMVCHKR